MGQQAFLEQRVRGRIQARDNITLRRGWEAVRPLAHTPDRITGVIVNRPDRDHTESLPADLVIDATGRAAHSRTWLRDLGYPQPPEQRCAVRLGYATRTLNCGIDALGGDRAFSRGPQPSCPQGLALVAQEHGRWLLTVYGYGDQRPDHHPDRFMANVRALAPDDIWAAVRTAEPTGDISVFNVPHTYRRRYESLRRFPEGLLVTGDALCTVNPIYGTGMMHAAAHAIILDRRLRHGLDRIHQGFFRDTGKAVSASWWLSTISDSTLPTVAGPRIPGARLAVWYLHRLVAAAEHDRTLAAEFIHVAGALHPPTALLRPSCLIQALKPQHSPRRDPLRSPFVQA